MKWKFNDLLILMVIFAVLMFFGTAVWMVVQNITSGKVRWVFDILSAFSLYLVIVLAICLG